MARIAVFAFDLTEASQIRRIKALRALGHDVSSISYRRGNMNADFTPDWPDLPLGTQPNENLRRRFFGLGKAVLKVLRRPAIFKQADVIIARNADLLALASVLRILLRRQDTPLIYECLDIHSLFTRPGIIGRIARRAERALLNRTSMVIVSSPGFVRNYFHPVQGYDGPIALIENKLWFDGPPLARPKRPRPADGSPLVVGSVGSIRCQTSLDILCQTADRMGGDLKIALFGNVHRHALTDFDAQIARHPNVHYYGPYRYPGDLGQVYRACDLVWAQDLWQQGGNSDWLLPNRIYEASWFGCPSIAVHGTETGRRIETDGLGVTVSEPTADALTRTLGDLSKDKITAMSARILAKPDTAFRLTAADLAEALAPVLPAPEPVTPTADIIELRPPKLKIVRG